MTSKVKLGDFEFQHSEIPDEMPWGGSQEITKLVHIGGARTLQAMGRDDKDIEWKGLFSGRSSAKRAQYIDGLRTAGNVLVFTYFDRKYNVIIKSFEASYKQAGYIPYTISLIIQDDLTNPIKVIVPAGYIDNIQDDVTAALDIAQLVFNPNILVALEVLDVFLGTIQPDANITLLTASTIENLIKGVANLVGDGITSLEKLL